MQRLDAAWVLPVVVPPIRDGSVLLDDRGRIAAVGPRDAVPSSADVPVHDLGDVAIVPGLVNTHTHLELTGFAGQVEDADFWEWITHIIALKSARTDEEFFHAAEQGIRDCWAGGVTTVCDLGNSGQVIAALDHLGASGVAHHEVFDMHTADPEQVMRRFAGELEHLAPFAAGRVSLGVSPHAPYTVSGKVYRATGELARAHGVPIAVHIAEPPDESALLRDFTGTFADMLRARGVARLSDDAGLAHRVAGAARRAVAAHHLRARDSHRSTPTPNCCGGTSRPSRTARGATGVITAPTRRWTRYVAAGLRVGLGTDSEASVAPLDLLAEARAARGLTDWTRRRDAAGADAGRCRGAGHGTRHRVARAGKVGRPGGDRGAGTGEGDRRRRRCSKRRSRAVEATWLSGVLVWGAKQ